MIIAIHWDRQDLRNISIVPLCGKDGSFKYEITVVTGRQRGAGETEAGFQRSLDGSTDMIYLSLHFLTPGVTYLTGLSHNLFTWLAF